MARGTVLLLVIFKYAFACKGLSKSLITLLSCGGRSVFPKLIKLIIEASQYLILVAATS